MSIRGCASRVKVRRVAQRSTGAPAGRRAARPGATAAVDSECAFRVRAANPAQRQILALGHVCTDPSLCVCANLGMCAHAHPGQEAAESACVARRTFHRRLLQGRLLQRDGRQRLAAGSSKFNSGFGSSAPNRTQGRKYARGPSETDLYKSETPSLNAKNTAPPLTSCGPYSTATTVLLTDLSLFGVPKVSTPWVSSAPLLPSVRFHCLSVRIERRRKDYRSQCASRTHCV